MALKIVREWVNQNGYNSNESYEAFCHLVGKTSYVLNEN